MINLCIPSVEGVISSTKRIFYPTEEIISATEGVFYPTEEIISATEGVFHSTEGIISATEGIFHSTEEITSSTEGIFHSSAEIYLQLWRLHQSSGKKQFEGRRKSGFIERKRRIVQKSGEMAAASNFGNEVV